MHLYTFLTDPGHGWLSVPMSDVLAVGVADRISRYSYRRGNRAYLEEDCDAPRFLAAADAAGLEYQIEDSGRDAGWVRSLPHYDPEDTDLRV